MKLYLDTSNNRETRLELDGQVLVKTYPSPQQQNLLVAIKELLDLKHINKRQLTQIEVNTGPGAFTSLRVGVAIANALGYGLKLPVNSQ